MDRSELYCRIETPKGSFVAQRGPVERWMPSPADCCYFPDTLDRAGRPLEAMVCTSKPGAPGTRVAVKTVALLRVHARGGWDEVVLCVALDDPPWEEIDRACDLPLQARKDIELLLIARCSSADAAPLVAWCSRDQALTAIDAAAARWAATVTGRADRPAWTGKT
jgi:inorganic pyrophosphatase